MLKLQPQTANYCVVSDLPVRIRYKRGMGRVIQCKAVKQQSACISFVFPVFCGFYLPSSEWHEDMLIFMGVRSPIHCIMCVWMYLFSLKSEDQMSCFIWWTTTTTKHYGAIFWVPSRKTAYKSYLIICVSFSMLFCDRSALLFSLICQVCNFH